MDPKKFKDPKGVEIGGNKYILSHIPAIQAQQVYGEIMKECKDDGDITMTYLSTETTLNLLGYAAHDVSGSGPDGWMPFNARPPAKVSACSSMMPVSMALSLNLV